MQIVCKKLGIEDSKEPPFKKYDILCRFMKVEVDFDRKFEDIWKKHAGKCMQAEYIEITSICKDLEFSYPSLYSHIAETLGIVTFTYDGVKRIVCNIDFFLHRYQ